MSLSKLGSLGGGLLGGLFGQGQIGSTLGNTVGGIADSLINLFSKTEQECRPMSDNSVIRTVGLGSVGGQQTQVYELYKSVDGSKQLNGIHLHMDVQAQMVKVQGVLQYLQTGYLFAVVVFTEPKQRAGALSPYTLQDDQETEEARIYEGAGVVVWARHGTVDGMMTREMIDLTVKNVDDFAVPINKDSRISLLGSIYTNFEDPQQSLNYQSAIFIGKVELNIIGRKEDPGLL